MIDSVVALPYESALLPTRYIRLLRNQQYHNLLN